MGCCPSKPSAAEQAIGEIEERERAMSGSNIGEIYVNPLLAQNRAAKTKSTENGGSIVLNTAFRHTTGGNGEPASSGDAIDGSALRSENAQLKAQLAESSRNSSREASTAAAEIAQLKAQLAEAERTTIIDAAPAAQYHMAAATPVPGHAESQSSSGLTSLTDPIDQKEQELVLLMSLHFGTIQQPALDLCKRREVVDQKVQALGNENRALLAKAADAVVNELRTMPFQAARDSAARLDEAIRTTLPATSPTSVKELQPLTTHLQCIQDLLQVFAHTTLSYCTLPIDNEAAVLGTLSTILVEPAEKHVKEAMAGMCEWIEREAALFQKKVVGKGTDDNEIYKSIFKKYTGDSVSYAERRAYMSVLTQIAGMEKALKARVPPVTQQPVSDVLKLALQFRTCETAFEGLANLFKDGIQGVELKLRQGLKALYRMIEKGILKGGSNTGDWRAALSPDAGIDCSNILDGVGCLFLCESFLIMDELVAQIISVVEADENVDTCRIKNRWMNPSAGGWRDLMLNFVVGDITVEVQVAHQKMFTAREQFGGHDTYSDIRCFQELLAFTGNEPEEAMVANNSTPVSCGIIFSHHADQLPFVAELIQLMSSLVPGLQCFSGGNFFDESGSREVQWLKAHQHAKICICVLTKEYLQSSPCCLEWDIATRKNETRVVLAVDSPDDIIANVDSTQSRNDENADIYMHLRNNNPVLLKSGKTVSELCDAIKETLSAGIAPVRPTSAKVDVLVVVDYPSESGGSGCIEPARFVAPLLALKDALDAKFLGTQVCIRFHTPQSIVKDDMDLMKERIPCLCWIAMGEEAPAAEGSVFSSSLWAKSCGGCDFAIVAVKHGANALANKLLSAGCADRVLWIAADYTAESTSGFFANGTSKPAAIPEVLHAALTGVDFENERSGRICCKPAIDLAEKRGNYVGLLLKDGCTSMSRCLEDGDRPLDRLGISLSRTPSSPAYITNKTVGVPGHTSVDLKQWPGTCDLLEELNNGCHGSSLVATLTGGTALNRKTVALKALQTYITVAGRFDLVVYRDADMPKSLRLNPELFDLPFDTHGVQDVLVWMDSQSTFPLEDLRDVVVNIVNTHVNDTGIPLRWTFILTAGDNFVDVSSDFQETDAVSFVSIALPDAIGTTVNESSEDLICIMPSDPSLKILNILDAITAEQLLEILAVALPQTDAESASGVKDYLDQILIGDNNSIIVRGMAPNTKFLFELRNDLIDGSLERRINDFLPKYASAATLCGQTWKLDKAAFSTIYPQILSQMDQLSPHQREKLQECATAQRVHVTGPAGCGKTFIALHMVVDLIEAAEQSSGTLSKENPILFVGKNKALCMFFVNWISNRLRKNKKTKVAIALVEAYLRVLHTSPFGDQVFAMKFTSSTHVDLVSETVSATYALVIVDEAHHIFATGGNGGDCRRVTHLCTSASQSLLLSDISQTESSGDVVFPPGHNDVVLKEVVRNSSRIVTASLPFCRSDDLADVTCNHGVRGPPLQPYLFDNCGSNDSARYAQYVEGIMHGMKHMDETFPGAEFHDNLVILVPDEAFKKTILSTLEVKMKVLGIEMVDAVVGAFSETRKSRKELNRIVLDTLESFDGMERLFVFAVGLDSVKTTEGCCGIYRAITRAHMFVCVVQEHLKGGWLEFMGTVKPDETDFDEKKERERVVRENLVVIDSSQAANVDSGVARDDANGENLNDANAVGDASIIAVVDASSSGDFSRATNEPHGLANSDSNQQAAKQRTPPPVEQPTAAKVPATSFITEQSETVELSSVEVGGGLAGRDTIVDLPEFVVPGDTASATVENTHNESSTPKGKGRMKPPPLSANANVEATERRKEAKRQKEKELEREKEKEREKDKEKEKEKEREKDLERERGRRLEKEQEKEKEKPLVKMQNVWNLNMNAEAFSTTISTLDFDPLTTQVPEVIAPALAAKPKKPPRVLPKPKPKPPNPPNPPGFMPNSFGKIVWAPDIAEGFVIGEVCDFGTSVSLHSTTLPPRPSLPRRCFPLGMMRLPCLCFESTRSLSC